MVTFKTGYKNDPQVSITAGVAAAKSIMSIDIK